LLRESPGDVALLCRRARAYTALKRWKEAHADCDEAIRLQRQLVEAWLTRGLLEYRQGRLEQGHADLARAAEVAPDDPAVAAWQAILYVVDKQEKKAAAAEKRMLEQLPFLLGVTAIRPDAAPAYWNPFAKVDPAWTLLNEELTQRLAADAKAHQVLGATTVGLGGVAMGQGPFLAVSALIAGTTDAEAVRLLRLRGVVGVAKGRYGWEAYNDFRQAATLAPKDVLAWKGFACASWRNAPQNPAGWRKQGLDACDAVLGLDADAWDFWYLRGLICVQDGQNQPALKAYTRALELHADFVPALRERGTAHAEMGQWAEAVADFAHAAELTGPADPAPWDSLALAQLGRGDTAAYKKTCARMLEMFGRPPPLIWAGGAFAAGPFNPCGAPLALHVADQAVRLSRDAAAVTAVRCTTRADALTDWQRLVPLTKKSPDEVCGKLFCRTGRYDEAVKLLEPLRTAPAGGLVPPGPDGPAPLLTLYLGLAEYGRGRTAEAKQLLKEATDWLDQPQDDNPKQKNRDRLPWTGRVEIDQLRRELEGLLKDKLP